MKRLFYRILLFFGNIFFTIGVKAKIKTIEAFPEELGDFHPEYEVRTRLTYSYKKQMVPMAGINNIRIETYKPESSAKKTKKKADSTIVVMDLIYATSQLVSPEFIKLVADSSVKECSVVSLGSKNEMNTIPIYELELEKVEFITNGDEYAWNARLRGVCPTPYLTI